MEETNLDGRMSFRDEVVSATLTNSNLERCIQCGTCGGSCPSGPDMDHTPREIFAMIHAGMRDDVLKSSTPWYCVSCYYCTERCPQHVHITDIMYTLKRMSIAEGKHKESDAKDAPDFSSTFMGYVDDYGRSFELGVATWYHLKHHRLSAVKMASMGLGMLLKGRLDLRPHKIKNLDQLKAILAKSREVEG